MDDIQKLELKKYERLYDLTLVGLNHEIERYRKIDNKIHYYITVLAILLGITTTLAPKLFDTIGGIRSFSSYIFLFTFGLMYLADLLSLSFLVFALKLDDIWAYPVDSKTVKYFDDQSYVDILYRHSESMVEAISYDREIIKKKVARAYRGFKLLLLSLMLLPINTSLYLFITL